LEYIFLCSEFNRRPTNGFERSKKERTVDAEREIGKSPSRRTVRMKNTGF
jgi:hypothetical protein